MRRCLDVTIFPQMQRKEGVLVSAKILHSLRNKIWNVEDIPQSGKAFQDGEGVFVCENWRGIMLLTIASKVFCKTILERMIDTLDIRDEQAGFCKERSCCDQITTLRFIVEQTLE